MPVQCGNFEFFENPRSIDISGLHAPSFGVLKYKSPLEFLFRDFIFIKNLIPLPLSSHYSSQKLSDISHHSVHLLSTHLGPYIHPQ